VSCKLSEPEDYGGDGDFGEVVSGSFGVTSSKASELFESVETSLDDVAACVFFGIKIGWSAALRSLMFTP
jgi:hypothetical protein